MSAERGSPALLLIAQEPARAYKIESVLSDSFTVTRATPQGVTRMEIENAGYYVFADSILEMQAQALDSIRERVQNGNCLLLLMGKALEYPDDENFFAFCGAKLENEDERPPFHVRIFPHYLTRGLPEEYHLGGCAAINARFHPGFSAHADNVFMRDTGDRILSYEKVYGLKGRVVVIALRSLCGLSPVEESILRNLRLLQCTAENVDSSFQSGITGIIPFRKDAVMEQTDDICRWNTLFTEDRKSSAYTHSSVFLPGSPEFSQKRIAVWIKPENGRITREKLLESFLSVEIRNTDFCPQNCYYCYNRRDMDIRYERTALPEEAHRALEKDLLDMKNRIGHAFSVRYTGAGEPLNHARTLPSLLGFEKAGIPTILVTNGELMDENGAETLGKSASYVRFSVDAAEPGTYASIRRCGAGAFDMVMGNIARVASGGCFVGATFLVCRENFRQIHAFCEKMKALGVRAVWIRSTDSCDPFADDEMALIQSEIERSKTLCSENFRVMADQFIIYRKVSLLHYKYDDSRCWSCFTKAFIQPNGNVIACLSRPDFKLGSILEQPFSDIWGGERHIRFLRETDFSACSQCIEARYNSAVDFLARNSDQIIYKGTRLIHDGPGMVPEA